MPFITYKSELLVDRSVAFWVDLGRWVLRTRLKFKFYTPETRIPFRRTRTRKGTCRRQGEIYLSGTA